MGCVRETPQIKKEKEKKGGRKKNEKKNEHGMCKRNSPDEKRKEKNEASTGCVRKTPHIKMKAARDV